MLERGWRVLLTGDPVFALLSGLVLERDGHAVVVGLKSNANGKGHSDGANVVIVGLPLLKLLEDAGVAELILELAEPLTRFVAQSLLKDQVGVAVPPLWAVSRDEMLVVLTAAGRRAGLKVLESEGEGRTDDGPRGVYELGDGRKISADLVVVFEQWNRYTSTRLVNPMDNSVTVRAPEPLEPVTVEPGDSVGAGEGVEGRDDDSGGDGRGKTWWVVSKYPALPRPSDLIKRASGFTPEWGKERARRDLSAEGQVARGTLFVMEEQGGRVHRLLVALKGGKHGELVQDGRVGLGNSDGRAVLNGRVVHVGRVAGPVDVLYGNEGIVSGLDLWMLVQELRVCSGALESGLAGWDARRQAWISRSLANGLAGLELRETGGRSGRLGRWVQSGLIRNTNAVLRVIADWGPDVEGLSCVAFPQLKDLTLGLGYDLLFPGSGARQGAPSSSPSPLAAWNWLRARL